MKNKAKKNIKLLFIIILLIISIFAFTSIVLGFDTNIYKPDDITVDQAKPILDKTGVIFGTVKNIGIVASVLSLMLIGIKYIFGSVEEKADYKKLLGPYVIGFVFVAGITSIVTFIYNAMI